MAKALQVTQAAWCYISFLSVESLSPDSLQNLKSFKRTTLDSKNICSFTTATHYFYSSKWSQTCLLLQTLSSYLLTPLSPSAGALGGFLPANHGAIGSPGDS